VDKVVEKPPTEVTTDVLALPVLLRAVLLLATPDTLEFDARDVELEIEEAKGGGGTAVEGSTSPPIPQRITSPSASVVESVGAVIGLVVETIANRPVQVSFCARGAMN